MTRNTFVQFVSKEVNSRNFTSPYVYKEFPKYVTLADGSSIIVKNEDEEFAAVGVEKEPEDHSVLLSRAKELGLKTHHKMSAETLLKLINEGNQYEKA